MEKVLGVFWSLISGKCLVHKYHQLRGTERVDVQLSPNMCTLCSSKVLKMCHLFVQLTNWTTLQSNDSNNCFHFPCVFSLRVVSAHHFCCVNFNCAACLIKFYAAIVMRHVAYLKFLIPVIPFSSFSYPLVISSIF
jgi:hypothetical protein